MGEASSFGLRACQISPPCWLRARHVQKWQLEPNNTPAEAGDPNSSSMQLAWTQESACFMKTKVKALPSRNHPQGVHAPSEVLGSLLSSQVDRFKNERLHWDCHPRRFKKGNGGTPDYTSAVDPSARMIHCNLSSWKRR